MAQAKKDEQVVSDTKVETTTAQDESQKTPDSALTNGERDGSTVRTPTIAQPEPLSFDERTGVRQPFVRDDGTQDNGARDLDKTDKTDKTPAK